MIFDTLRETSVVPAILALIPGLAAWWSGRRLAPLADDPAFPERLAADRRRNGMLLLVALAALAVLGLGAVIWIPIAVCAALAGGYPLRRVIYGETWTLGAYIWFYLRFLTAWMGFWIALTALPFVVSFGGTYDWALAVALAALLAGWNRHYPDVFLACLRARPIDDSRLLDRFRAMADRCALGSVRFDRFDLNGGVFANAFALPSTRAPGVVISSTLLERLDEDEVVAICAHELAHLEHYTPARLRRLSSITNATIAIGTLWTPAQRLAGFDQPLVSAVVWLAIVVAALTQVAKGRRQNETESDERAVALVGQPDSLAAALTRLHTIARVPRRIGAREEQSSSHPSLARRIRDVRKAGGTTAPSLATAAAITSADGKHITFDDLGVQWTDGGGLTVRLAYSHVTELRVDARGRDVSRLRVAGVDGRHWSFPLRTEDVATIQSLLDVVDGRLAGALPPRRLPVSITRLLAIFAASLAGSLGHVIVAILAIIAFFRPMPAALLAAGAGALAAAGIALRGSAGGERLSAATAIVLAAIALAMVIAAYRKRGDRSLDAKPLVAALTIASALAIAMLTLNGVDAVRLHQTARNTPAAVALLAALAGTLLASDTRHRRMLTAASAALTIAVAAVGSAAFLDTIARDPLLVPTPPLVRHVLRLDPVMHMPAPSGAGRLLLSPDDRHVAARIESDSEDAHAIVYHVAAVGGTWTQIAADDLVLIGNGQLLRTASDERGTVVSAHRIGESEPVWSTRVDGLLAATLSYDARATRWTLLGWDAERAIVRASGVVGTDRVEQHTWPARATRDRYVSTIAAAGGSVLVHETRFDRGALDGLPLPAWTWLHLQFPFNQQSRVWTMSDRGVTELWTSRLGSNCVPGPAPTLSLVCATFDGTRTRLVTIEDDGRVRAIGLVDGRLVVDRGAGDGWLSGWLQSSAVTIDVANAALFTLPRGRTFATHLASNGRVLAAIEYEDDNERIAISSLR